MARLRKTLWVKNSYVHNIFGFSDIYCYRSGVVSWSRFSRLRWPGWLLAGERHRHRVSSGRAAPWFIDTTVKETRNVRCIFPPSRRRLLSFVLLVCERVRRTRSGQTRPFSCVLFKSPRRRKRILRASVLSRPAIHPFRPTDTPEFISVPWHSAARRQHTTRVQTASTGTLRIISIFRFAKAAHRDRQD